MPDQQQPPTCATCGDRIEVREALVAVGNERFHVTCWQVLRGAESVGPSRHAGRTIASQGLIERAEPSAVDGSERRSPPPSP